MPNKKDATAPSNISGVTIDFASVANANAAGTLTYTVAGNTLQWTANGDTIGDAVGFTADATKIIYSSDKTKYIQVTVVFASMSGAPVGPDSITVSENIGTMNNLFYDYASAQLVDGAIEHSGFFLKNTHVLETIHFPKLYISLNTAYAGDFIEFIFEEPSTRTGGFIQSIEDAGTMPIGLGTTNVSGNVWERVTTKPTAIGLPGVTKLPAGDHIGLWYRRILSAGSPRFANNIFNVTLFGDVPSIGN